MDPQQQNYWQPQRDEPLAQPPQPANDPQNQPPQPTQPIVTQPPIEPAYPQPQLPAQPVTSQYSGYDLTANATPAPQPANIAPAAPVEQPDHPVSWDASEYIHHQKGLMWYVIFGLIAAGLLGVSIWLQAWTFSVLIVVMAIAMMVYALRMPRSVHYSLTSQGINVSDKFYTYTSFRAFGVIPDSGQYSIMLLPTKRFMPAITLYFEQNDGDTIVDMLGSHLPMEDLDHDPIDKLMRHLRF